MKVSVQVFNDYVSSRLLRGWSGADLLGEPSLVLVEGGVRRAMQALRSVPVLSACMAFVWTVRAAA